VAATALIVAVAVLFTMVRAFSYAIWLAIPMVAAGVVRMFASVRLGTMAVRALIALFLAPAVTAAVALAAVQAMTAPSLSRRSLNSVPVHVGSTSSRPGPDCEIDLMGDNEPITAPFRSRGNLE
jgi:hypothetical protein